MSDNPLKELLEKAGKNAPDLLHPHGSPDHTLHLATEDNDDDDDAPITLGVRQPSFARLHGAVIPKGASTSLGDQDPIVMEEEPGHRPDLHKSKHVEDNPVVVLGDGGDDDDDTPIGLGVRQPSFAQLHGPLVLKGDNEELKMMEAPEEKAEEGFPLSSLGPRQSSYARLHLGNQISHPAPVNHLPGVVEEKPVESNPRVVAGNDDDDDDDDDAPIGLSVRQPSYSSLHGVLIPKGGLENIAAIEPVIEEEPNKGTNEVHGLGPRQSSYARLRMLAQTTEPQHTLPTLEELAKDTSNPVIVATKEDEDEDDDGPIELNVRQPSYSSLHGVLIPKGGMEAVVHPIIEEEPEQKSPEGKKLGMHPRQSSYSNLRMANQIKEAPVHEAPPPIREEVDPNPVIVLTKDGEDEDDDAPIELNVRQPSYSSLHGVIIPKGGGVGTLMTEIVEEEATPAAAKSPQQAPMALGEVDSEMKQSVLSSLHEFNQAKWKEMGYEPNSMKRNCSCSMFQVQEKIAPPSSLTQNRNMSYLFGGIQGLNQNQQKPKLQRVNSAGGKREPLPEVEMPLTEKDSKPVPERPLDRGPSLVRVNSFGHASQEMIVEMPIPEEGDENEQEAETADDEQIEEEEEEVADECRIPPRLQQIVHHPKDSVVYLALCGACITGYHDKTVHYVLGELKKYEKSCADRGYKKEVEYLRGIMNEIKSSTAAMEAPKKKASRSELAQTEKRGHKKPADIKAERDQALQELDEYYAQQREDLDEAWNSEAMCNRFNKPSAALVAMRRAAQKMAKDDRLEENSILRQKIAEKEEEESAAATRKMEKAYEAAVNELQAQYEIERKKIIQRYDDKQHALSSFMRTKEQCLGPIQMRVAKGSPNAKPACRANRALYHTHDIKKYQTAKRQVHMGTEKLTLPPLHKLKAESIV